MKMNIVLDIFGQLIQESETLLIDLLILLLDL
jgi:hypothetical protein